jgi:MFS transporter, PPP family, 3-phenylpropionic acid transporter
MLASNRNLAILRSYYLMLGIGGGFLSPFLSLFYKQQGLSGTQIGLLATFAGMAALIAAPLWGRLSDAAIHPRRWLQVELIASCVCLLLLSQQVAFVPIALFVVLNALVNAGSSPASDALVMTVLNKIRSGFGSVRLFASLGWAIAALLSGWLIGQLGLFVIFIGYIFGYASGAGAVSFIRLPPRSVSRTLAQQPRLSIRSAVRQVLHNRRLRGLAFALIIFGFMMYGLRSFEALYLKQLGAPSTIVGLMSTIGATIELPGMLWADRLVRRYGAARVLRYSFLLEVVRLCGVLLVPSVPTLLLMRAVGGISFSWYVVSVLGFIYESVPEQRVTTTLALFNVTLPAFINMVAAPTSGFIFDQVGGYYLYALGAIGSAAAWLVMKTLVTSNK